MKALSFQSYMKTSGHKERILVVDDEDKILAVISEYFIIQGYEVRTAIDAKEALQEFTPGKFHCVISDFSMPGMDGIELLKEIKTKDPKVIFLIITGYPSIERAVEAIKLGAYDYITKPIDLNDLQIKVERALYTKKLEDSLKTVNERLKKLIILIPIIVAILIFLSICRNIF